MSVISSVAGSHLLEDMSSLGMDFEESATQATNPSTSILDSHLEEQAQYYEKNALIVDGFRCPNEFINILTPMEFEEMVNLFTKFDANNSGTIDRHETKKILHFIGLDYSMQKAEELLRIVDSDGSGEIDFDEFCNFIVMIKRGDERLAGFGAMMDKLNSTPLGELERQAIHRELKMRFEIVETREATLFNPTLYVVEVTLAGMWHQIVGGDIVSEYGVRKFQGMGNNTREAKYAAATAALVKLGDSMPGMKFKPGVFPDEWLQWVDDNLLRGVEPGRVVSILASKGFHPHKNNRLMHRILAWHSLLGFQARHPEVDLSEDAKLNDDFMEWIKNTAKKGIDGEIIYQLLKDRYIDLQDLDVSFCQQLRNNELGSLMGKNEEQPNILDFWHACRSGYLEDVIIYCKCGVTVNDEVIDRHTTERITALGYASLHGHADVVKVLLQYNADLKYIDRRGRNCVHLAAMRGHLPACQVLIDRGGRLFAGDMHGNSPLHLAAMNNHFAVVDYLAAKGQELARTVTSDKVRGVKGSSFLELCTKVFEAIPAMKLGPAETVRYEKKWLHAGAVHLVAMLDEDVRFMLPRSCEEIMEDVLARFDPRPETGVFVTNDVTGDQVFVKTIGSPQDLSVLLNYTYRQAAIDSINRFHRTALHMACDANKVASHEKLILRLVDDFGCNVNLKDMHGRRAVDLLVQDKVMRDAPSSTETRERVLMGRRQAGMDQMFDEYEAIDRQRMEDQRQRILDECLDRGWQLEDRVWNVLREASLFKKRFGEGWEMYEDPDTLNLFYAQAPDKKVMGDGFRYRDYCWEVPAKGKAAIDYCHALDCYRRVRATLKRRYGDWEVYRDEFTSIDFYYHPGTTALRFSPPAEMEWPTVFKESVNTGERLGYGREWDVYTDKHGNTFYRHRITKECLYDRPVDAVVITPKEMLCTAYQHKDKVLDQKWYSCEQCNRAWKTNAAEMLMSKTDDGTSGGGAGGGAAMTKSLVVCEPCIFRCHATHKGVRFLMQAPSSRTLYCMCMEVSRLTQMMCRACQVSETQMKVQSEAECGRVERERHARRNEEYPPIFALVPRYDRRGQPKVVSGWHICRQAAGERAKLNGEVAGGEGNDGDEERGGELLVIEDRERSSDESGSSSDDDDRSAAASKAGDAHGDDGAAQVVVPISAAGLTGRSRKTQLAGQSLKMHTQGGWVEVFDVEEPEHLRHGDVVLCLRYAGPPRVMARVRTVVRPGFYKLRYDDRTLPEEVMERSHLELISRPKFFFHTTWRISAWSREDGAFIDANGGADCERGIRSQSLTLTGDDWVRLYKNHTLRRAFDDWDEVTVPLLDQVIFVHTPTLEMEKAALRLQNAYRQRFLKPRPALGWRSSAYSFDMPNEVLRGLQVLCGWAYLRRRARSVGDFVDVEGDEWEEYEDLKTAEFFYWQEDDNRYQWDKPQLYQRTEGPEASFKVGDEVVFKFPGRRNEETAVVTKVRFDDETGEDKYDIVHKYNPELALRWIPRMRIRAPMMEGDALALNKLEGRWRQIIRRRREAEQRKAQREREARIQAELQQLEVMNSLAFKFGNKGGDQISTTTRLLRGRIERIAIEAQVVREEIDRAEGQGRRDRVYKQIADLKAEFGSRMTRADELKMARSLDLKLQMEDRVAKRNALQAELLLKKEEAVGRIVRIETELRDQEVVMTTPRSMRRRKIIRRTHIAMKRQGMGFMICEWGCGDWFRVGHEQQDHQKHRCVKRILPCALGCTVKNTEEAWLAPFAQPCAASKIHRDAHATADATAAAISDPFSVTQPSMDTLLDKEDRVLGAVTYQQHHETDECVKRLVMCPLQCLEWVPFEVLERHVQEICVKRPAEPLLCRLGCSTRFGGTVEMLLQAEDERNQHEAEECEFRQVRCNWQFEDGKACAAMMRACDRAEHRDYHLHALGVTTYAVPGVYTYRIPKKLTRIKVQIWGAGGGSGFFLGRQGGDGGGGGYVEAILDVEPFSVLEITVGSGGAGGVQGTEVQAPDLDAQRGLAAERRAVELSLPMGTKIDPNALSAPPQATTASYGTAAGGSPGGGEGYAGGLSWACGGGGGYSSLCRRTARGTVVFLVASGGGGGASQSGRPGAALDGELPGTRVDPINGGTASVHAPGRAGESGSTFNSQWPAAAGAMWQGGGGCEFGAGGGGGYYGGGGGGTSPGISGGGGGGASFVNTAITRDYVVIHGHGLEPGGMHHDPPEACGVGEWDRVGGRAGQGGRAQPTRTFTGNNGAVRISKPGHY